MIDLEEIEARTTLKRWPTQAELGQLQVDNKDLIARIRELEHIMSHVEVDRDHYKELSETGEHTSSTIKAHEATIQRVRELCLTETSPDKALVHGAWYEVLKTLDGTP